jgi:peptidoglycan hydrolase CwlO-like protein
MDKETRQDEIYSVAKSIEHSNTVRKAEKAEIDNLTHKVSYVEGTISALGEVIEKRKAIQ